MRGTLVFLLLAGVVAVILALPRSSPNPVPGQVYENIETGDRIVVDDVGTGGEIIARYRMHNRELDEMDLSDRARVTSIIVPVSNEADSLRASFSYLGEEVARAEPGEVYIFDGAWHQEVPVTVAYIRSVSWLRANYALVSANP